MVRASSAMDAFSNARPWRKRVLVRAWGSGVLSRRIGTIGFPRLAAAIHSLWTHGDRAARFDHRSTSARLARMLDSRFATEKRAESDFRMIEPDWLRPEARFDDFGLGGVLSRMADERVEGKLRLYRNFKPTFFLA